MPLIHSKSKKAFQKNVETEMKANPNPEDRKRNLAIAYSVKRKAKKASGGTVESGSRDMNMADGGEAHSGAYHAELGQMRQREKAARETGASTNTGPLHTPEQETALRKKHYGESMKLPEPRANQVSHKPGRYAEGGMAEISAKTEKRPMPDDTHSDSDETRRNKGNKAPGEDSWTDQPTVTQARKPSITRLSQPRMTDSNVIQVKMRDDEGDLMDRVPPSSDKDQPDRLLNEEDATKQDGDPDMTKPHTTAKAYAKGGKVSPIQDKELQGNMDMNATEGKRIQESMKADDMKRRNQVSHKPGRYAEGGLLDLEDEDRDVLDHNMSEDDEYGDGAEEDRAPGRSPLDGLDDEDTLPVDEYMAGHFAEGGRAGGEQDSWDDDGHEDSIAAAIMSRRDRLHDEIDSGAHDLDEAVRMALGGEAQPEEDGIGKRDGLFDFVATRKPSAQAIKSHGSMDSDDSDQVDLSRNADEDANEEDQASFDALRKENYSESDGLDDLGDQPEGSNLTGDQREADEENKHDRVSAIMAQMNSKRQFKRR